MSQWHQPDHFPRELAGSSIPAPDIGELLLNNFAVSNHNQANLTDVINIYYIYLPDHNQNRKNRKYNFPIPIITFGFLKCSKILLIHRK